MSKVLLSLDTLVDRPRIVIDGKSYELVSPDELPVLTSHMLSVKSKRMEALTETAELEEAERAELRAIVVEMSDAIMEPVPAAVRAQLSEQHRCSVIEVFSTLLLSKKAATAAALIQTLMPPEPKPPKKATGEPSSGDSNASTAGRRGGGSPKRRSRS